MTASLPTAPLHLQAQYPQINNYSLIAQIDDIVFLYRPESNRIILVSVLGNQPKKLRVSSFVITSCTFAIANLEGFITGILRVDLYEHQQPIKSRVICLSDTFVRLYPIRA